MSLEKSEVLKKFLYKMADDALIIGHRNMEWTGVGPILEEDIAFSSIAQDKLGHALQLYAILHDVLGEKDPDTIAFTRNEKDFSCCHLVEHPIGEYDFSLVRHFYFDNAEMLRFSALTQSSFEPLAKLSNKIKGEIKYHVFHANTWINQLANGTEESKARIQSALNSVFPLALGIFEQLENESELIKSQIFIAENDLKNQWYNEVKTIVESAGLNLPELNSAEPVLGGRKGYHTEYLQPLLTEMTEVFRIDPTAEW